jgi:anti-anti-sigma factor
MEIEETRDGEIVILAPHGKLDTAAEAAFERKLKDLLAAQARYIVVDFAKVEYVSGGALRALLLITRRLTPRGGRMVLCRLSDVVLQAFTIAGLDRVLSIVPSRDDAVFAAFSAGAQRESARVPEEASDAATSAPPEAAVAPVGEAAPAEVPAPAEVVPAAPPPAAPPDDRIPRLAARVLPLVEGGTGPVFATAPGTLRPGLVRTLADLLA